MVTKAILTQLNKHACVCTMLPLFLPSLLFISFLSSSPSSILSFLTSFPSSISFLLPSSSLSFLLAHHSFFPLIPSSFSFLLSHSFFPLIPSSLSFLLPSCSFFPLVRSLLFCLFHPLLYLSIYLSDFPSLSKPFVSFVFLYPSISSFILSPSLSPVMSLSPPYLLSILLSFSLPRFPGRSIKVTQDALTFTTRTRRSPSGSSPRSWRS